MVFNLPEQSYKVRADFLGQKFWSNPFTWQDITVTIPMADAEITVTSAGAPVEGVNVYVFTASGSYLSMNGATNSEGKVYFHVPAGEYKFRADYQGSHYWSNVATLTAGQVNSVEIDTGGGGMTFTVLKGPGVALPGVNCYVFNESGSYLSIRGTTDASGQVFFNLSEGGYKIRVDYLGCQFWSPVYTINGNLTETFAISHQNVTLTVQGNYPSMAPISGVPVYLFTEGGAYVSQHQTTDLSGQVTFNLPEQSYKVRADYLGRHFWSDPFTWQNTMVTINQGLASIHVVRSGSDVPGANVYLFSETVAYLGTNQTTDASGKAEFLLPSVSFKFRVDEGGNQYWSPVINIQPGVVNKVNIDISPITVNISADSENIQAGESSTLTWNSTGANTCTIEPDIGTVDVNGSMQVSPAETTTYTITATGPSGTATDSITVTVTAPPSFSETKLTASDASGFAFFGEAVSIYGDTAIVGAPNAVNGGVKSGAAYIFQYNGSAWVEQAKLVPGDGAEWDFFGTSVSIYGDTAVVGASGVDSQWDRTGAAYVFKREGAAWTQQAKLTASDAYERAYFGGSVSIYGDYVIVGAEGGYYVEIETGAAYIFKREGTTWTQQAKLTPSNWKYLGSFGYSVSIYEDYAIVGGGNNLNETGDANCAAYIFKRDGTSWLEQSKLFVQGFSDEGSSVSIYKDYAIVGTPWSIKDGIYQGAAFVFKRDGSVWDQQAQLTASDPTEDNYFGSSVAIYENDAVVGAIGNFENNSYIGAAYIFKQENSVWFEQVKLTASDADQWPICEDPWDDCTAFGWSVALHGGKAIIGDYSVETNGVMQGAAYIYSIHNVTVELNADPITVQPGESATLSWNSNNASSCVIEPGIDTVDTNGSIQVSPEATTTYTITATGPGGTATDNVTVSVGMPPVINANLNPETVNLGESCTLTWNTMHTDSLILWTSIYGPTQTFDLPLSGSITEFPTQTTTFYMEASGSGGTTTYSNTVAVLEPPVVSISADPEIIHIGESTTLTWNTTNADTCNIEPDVGSVDVNGSITVSPSETTTYTITATGPDGTATATVEVDVILERDPDNGFHSNNQLGGDGVVGERISILNGNSVESRLDLRFSFPNGLGFIFQATYNSQSDIPGSLGFGWSNTYSAVLDPTYALAGQTYLKIVDQTGRAVYFKEETSGLYKGAFNELSKVQAEAGGYVWYRLDGSKFGFSSTGQILWMDDEKDNRLALAYDAQNRMQTVADISSGRMLTFNYTAGGLLESISGPVTQGVPSGIWATYGYDANQNLTSVTYADGSGFDYTYSDPNDMHNLTEKNDKAGHLLVSHPINIVQYFGKLIFAIPYTFMQPSTKVLCC